MVNYEQLINACIYTDIDLESIITLKHPVVLSCLLPGCHDTAWFVAKVKYDLDINKRLWVL